MTIVKATRKELGLRYRVDMKAGEMWNLDEKFLLKQLHDFPSNWHHLPIEAAFDVRAPNSTFLMVHVANVTVPREFDWSCDPNDSVWQSPKSRCPNENPNIFGTKGGKKSYEEFNDRLDKISIQDPTSIIDGRRTLFEVYPHLSISSYAPPCPKVRRFCDQSVGIANLENNRESERDFFVRNSRVVIRVVIASSAQKHSALISPRSFRRSASEPLNGMKPPTSVQRRVRRQLPANQLPQMPTFQFHITALKRTRPEAFSPCDDNWIACDTETCIPKTFWCDKIINCPQWQDEGLQCDKSNQLSSDDSDRNSLEVKKEREKQEAEEAAQKLHLSILGSLGLLLAVITTTCILMTVRRRKRERVRHIPKVKDNSVRLDGYSTRSGPRLNHVISTDVLAENEGRLARPDRSHGHSKAMFTLSKSNSAQDRGGIAQTQDMDRKQATESQVTTAWNSTDSVNAPLLWQRKPNKSMKKAMEPKTDEHALTKWNHIHPDDFIDIPSVRRTEVEHEGFNDDAQIPVVIRSPARMKSRVNSSTGGVRTQPIVPSSDHLMSHLTSPLDRARHLSQTRCNSANHFRRSQFQE
ncbi:hypothetical protein EG68_07733 [Paragonimus skrjabini miyazakii]|uniref:Uncharacterized protein n=1 Tax=Paragonimus skrjabini miyazakii TaxID=59628 RepID=A0A8S9YLM4_9TREM|nr:hypothetical protein EG68_07733 [Paragonimus skrjabini miyazakii]